MRGPRRTDRRRPSECLRRAALPLLLAVSLITACAGCAGGSSGASGAAPSRAPSATAQSSGPAPSAAARPAHVVVVVLENHSYAQVADQPFLSSLEQRSAVFTDAHAETHPSEPNYLALWSGSTQGLTDDSCPHEYATDSLGQQLLRAHLSVAGYFESLPSAGYLGCSAGPYARKHNPLADFAATAGAAHDLPFSAFPAGDPSALPRVALVVPNLDDDMHDGSVAAGDAWLRRHLAAYARWSLSHDSLLVVTWDENDRTPGNRILTLVAGQHVRPGRYGQRITHLSVLHTIEALYGLPQLGGAEPAITGVWR